VDAERVAQRQRVFERGLDLVRQAATVGVAQRQVAGACVGRGAASARAASGDVIDVL
jgi:hypothetical protein